MNTHSDGKHTIPAVMMISIDKIKELNKFVATAGKVPCKVSVSVNGYRIDAKSLLGCYSIDMTEGATLEVEDSIYIQEFERWKVHGGH